MAAHESWSSGKPQKAQQSKTTTEEDESSPTVFAARMSLERHFESALYATPTLSPVCRRRRGSDHYTEGACLSYRQRSYSATIDYVAADSDSDALYSALKKKTVEQCFGDADDHDEEGEEEHGHHGGTSFKRKLRWLNSRLRGSGRASRSGKAIFHGILKAPKRSLDNALKIKARIQNIRTRTSTWLQRLAILSFSIIAVLLVAFRACKSLQLLPGQINADGSQNRTVESIIESLFGQTSEHSNDSHIAIARSVLLKTVAIALLALLFTGTFVCERLFACQITIEQSELVDSSNLSSIPADLLSLHHYPNLNNNGYESEEDTEEDEDFFWTDYEIAQPCSCGCQNTKDDSTTAVVSSSLKINLLYLLPLRTISRAWGQINEVELPRRLRRPIYQWYAQTFGCNLEEIHPGKDLEDYRNLSEFFRRLLAPGVRPIGQSPIVSPADGRVVQLEELGSDGFIGSVKGVHYSITNFLGPRAVPQKLRAGNKLYGAVIYLAPGDYHRFHSPADWTVKYRRHFSGRLFSVKPSFVSGFPDLFSVQERVAYMGQWQHGFFSMTAVGATNVGTVNVYFDQELQTNQFMNSMNYRTEKLFKEEVNLSRGDLFGEFNLGSTIVLVFEAPAADTVLDCGLLDNKIKYGENLLRIQEIQA